MYLSFAHAYVVCPFPKAASVEKAFPDVGERELFGVRRSQIWQSGISVEYGGGEKVTFGDIGRESDLWSNRLSRAWVGGNHMEVILQACYF